MECAEVCMSVCVCVDWMCIPGILHSAGMHIALRISMQLLCCSSSVHVYAYFAYASFDVRWLESTAPSIRVTHSVGWRVG